MVVDSAFLRSHIVNEWWNPAVERSGKCTRWQGVLLQRNGSLQRWIWTSVFLICKPQADPAVRHCNSQAVMQLLPSTAVVLQDSAYFWHTNVVHLAGGRLPSPTSLLLRIKLSNGRGKELSVKKVNYSLDRTGAMSKLYSEKTPRISKLKLISFNL
jgi:hypothetical protein